MGAGKASYYVSFPRLDVAGTLNGARVAGTAWMDHEWFTHQLEPNQQGWDWFSVQLESGADLMLFQLRQAGGAIDPFSSGTHIAPDGRVTHLKRADFALQPIDWWTSPRTGTRYPVKWRIAVPSQHLALECRAAFPAQELVAEDGSSPTYWEGAVTYSGTAPGIPTGTTHGVGYLEMTGYDKPMRL